MNVVEVPVLQRHDTGAVAVGRMEAAGVGAALVANGSDAEHSPLALIYVSDAADHAGTALRNVPPDVLIPVGIPTNQARQALQAGTAQLHGGPPTPAEEVAWGLTGFRYAALVVAPNRGVLVTRSEADHVPLLRCERNPNHLFPRPDLVSGQLCPKCVTTSGAPPKVW